MEADGSTFRATMEGTLGEDPVHILVGLFIYDFFRIQHFPETAEFSSVFSVPFGAWATFNMEMSVHLAVQVFVVPEEMSFAHFSQSKCVW